MKKLFAICCLMIVVLLLKAHPGIGIVKDNKGNIYYTDLKQVWKVSPGGLKSVVVKGVHTHELYLDDQDNLYGEHLWYNGEAKDTWGHYAWCLRKNGELVRDIEPTEGFLTNYSFARDSAGNMYWVERFTTSRIMKKTGTGEVTKLIEGKFGFIAWLYSTRNGTLYFTENNKLHTLSPTGKLETVAENIGSRSTNFTVMGRNYDSYGIWTDNAGNIYLAMIDSKKVIRIPGNGKPETVITSGSLWTVTSGLFDNTGNMWVLENSVTNEVRVRKIDQRSLAIGEIPAGKTISPHLLVTIFTGLTVVLLFLVTKMILSKRRKKHIRLSF
jgi:hypothetical protein